MQKPFASQFTDVEMILPEIRLEFAMLCCFGLFFSSVEHTKNLLIMGPNNTKDCSLKCDFLILNFEYFCQNHVFILKNTKCDKKNSFFATC
jgi:hypothetical protein